MPILYPPAAPTISGDVVTISRFLNSPTMVARRLRTLVEQRFISDALLTGRFSVSGGAIQYETSEGIYSDRPTQSIAPGAEYPLTTVGNGAASIAATQKWGQDALVTDEAIKRQQFDPVDRALTKIVNQLVKTIDSLSLSAIATAVTQTIAATAAWGTPASARILYDALKAVANIRALNLGYDPDTLVVDDLMWANVMADPTITNALAREDGQQPVKTGQLKTLAGLTILPTPNLPTAGVALVLDSKVLGGMADEDLQSPGYVSASGVGVEAKTIREDAYDRWRIRARRVTVPVVIEPGAAWKITGV